MDEGPAHVVDFVHEIRIQVEWTAMVMDSIDPLVVRLTPPHSGEDVDFVTPSFQRGSQLGHVHTHAADTNRMQGLPGKHCDSHFQTYDSCNRRTVFSRPNNTMTSNRPGATDWPVRATRAGFISAPGLMASSAARALTVSSML